MTNSEIAKIIEWLYLNDGNYPDRIEWRKSFVKMLYLMMTKEMGGLRFVKVTKIDSDEAV